VRETYKKKYSVNKPGCPSNPIRQFNSLTQWSGHNS